MQLRNGKQIAIISKENNPVVEKPVVEKPVVEKPVVEKPVVEKPLDPEREKFSTIKKEICIISKKFFNSNEKYEKLRKNSDASEQSCRGSASTLALDGRDLVLKLHNVFNDPLLVKGMRYYFPLDTQEYHIILMRALYILDKLRERNLRDGPTVLYYYTLLYYLDETLKVCMKLLKSFGPHILWFSNKK